MQGLHKRMMQSYRPTTIVAHSFLLSFSLFRVQLTQWVLPITSRYKYFWIRGSVLCIATEPLKCLAEVSYAFLRSLENKEELGLLSRKHI